MVGGIAMAKKKGRPAKGPAGREDFIRIRMTGEFKAWLEEYATARNLTVTDTVIQAVIGEASARGFKPAPKR